ncbi:glycosyltransferase family 4 protein [Cellulophaga baltica]|uniref:glycosyltransferase family 4 protein n=1 Tax=Cellulophaga baltica TaxID=76594 RepID=UPI002494E4D9|nr:glycosyltransferase family 1 protein [Cellulophaga baltica]
MKIKYYFRHPKVGHSIHRVFRTLLQEIKKKDDIEIIEMPYKGSMPWDVIKNNLFVYKKKDKKSIHHVTGHIHDVLLALIGVKTVLTIHDLVFLDNVKNPFKKFYKWLFWLYLPIKIADRVVCISNQTKNNILTKISTKKLVVIYNPIDPIFQFKEKKFNKKKPVILHIGTDWNKNLDNTIEALAGVKCHLRIIGKLKDHHLESLEKFQVEYSNASNLSDIEIKDEYVNCDIVNFPSIYEGFGMPIIEGQRTGRIVLTSNLEPLIEVSSNSAILVDPFDINSIKNSYLKIIEDDKYREEIIKRGLENTKRFTVEKIALQYQNIYRQIL